jgi:hypothetical protein
VQEVLAEMIDVRVKRHSDKITVTSPNHLWAADAEEYAKCALLSPEETRLRGITESLTLVAQLPDGYLYHVEVNP